MFYEKASGRRNVRVAAGEGAVTPVEVTTVTYRDGSTERLIPDRHRFDPSHPLVRQRPELFTLCCKDDRTNAPQVFRDAHRAAMRATEREIRKLEGEPESPRRDSLRTYGRHQLGRPRLP